MTEEDEGEEEEDEEECAQRIELLTLMMYLEPQERIKHVWYKFKFKCVGADFY